MARLDLNGAWTLTFGPQPSDGDVDQPPADWPTIPAVVPGNVELDLIRAGHLPENLHQGNRIYLLRPLETYQWWYRRTFELPADWPAEREVDLVFEGLDCCGRVWLNGEKVGHWANNMLVEDRAWVHRHLLPGQTNELLVRIDSPILEARRHAIDQDQHASPCNWESLWIRKAPSMYGWDILPRVVSAGLWRDVWLDVLEPTRFRAVYWWTQRVDVAAGQADLGLDWQLETDRRELDGCRLRLTLSRDGQVAAQREEPVVSFHGRTGLHLSDAALWWPRGAGDQPLYDAELALLDADGEVLATHTCRLGVRTVQLERTDVTDETGGEFVFRVNGEKIFAKGTNWVPLDSLHSRDVQHVDAAVAMLADLNCNMVRCWGGNVYEDHRFFDLCDEAGILVWQDFAFACAVYPMDEGFLYEVQLEAEEVVTKLRNHASLALWAGNNEIDEAYRWSGLNLDPNVADQISRRVLPGVVGRLDPRRDYLPSSPYRSPEQMRRGGHDHHKPEDHLWGPRDDFKGPYYTSSPAHFVSEIGYHGCPERATLEAMMDPEFLWPPQDNDQWLTHAARPLPEVTSYNYRIELMSKQTAVLFQTVPTELEPYVLASQISQAEALKFFLERWRSGKWRRTGMLWWNLRDGWPVISDAVVDYYNRKKLAYAYLKRLQTDVCAMCGEPDGGRQQVFVVNDTRRLVAGEVTIRDAGSGQVLFHDDYTVDANGVTVAGDAAAPARPAMWLIDYTANGVTGHNHYLAGPRPFDLRQYARWIGALGLDPALAAVQLAAELA